MVTSRNVGVELRREHARSRRTTRRRPISRQASGQAKAVLKHSERELESLLDAHPGNAHVIDAATTRKLDTVCIRLDSNKGGVDRPDQVIRPEHLKTSSLMLVHDGSSQSDGGGGARSHDRSVPCLGGARITSSSLLAMT
jgi:hypothetical protein